LYLDETALRSIAYNSNMQESEVQLAFSDATTGTGQVADAAILLRNRPNPFSDETTIEFVLPEACEAQLRIYDATGRELWQADKYYTAGNHAERVNLAGVTAAGVLYYELTTPYGTRTKKMVQVGP
ncbi:MAG: T9SS type A sorting domain-containing protein, partial [Sinomicrobium sp.]|nr:T9SS type A sorting domain-containing protein [Sinomicrobium sp.]